MKTALRGLVLLSFMYNLVHAPFQHWQEVFDMNFMQVMYDSAQDYQQSLDPKKQYIGNKILDIKTLNVEQERAYVLVSSALLQKQRIGMNDDDIFSSVMLHWFAAHICDHPENAQELGVTMSNTLVREFVINILLWHKPTAKSAKADQFDYTDGMYEMPNTMSKNEQTEKEKKEFTQRDFNGYTECKILHHIIAQDDIFGATNKDNIVKYFGKTQDDASIALLSEYSNFVKSVTGQCWYGIEVNYEFAFKSFIEHSREVMRQKQAEAERLAKELADKLARGQIDSIDPFSDDTKWLAVYKTNNLQSVKAALGIASDSTAKIGAQLMKLGGHVSLLSKVPLLFVCLTQYRNNIAKLNGVVDKADYNKPLNEAIGNWFDVWVEKQKLNFQNVDARQAIINLCLMRLVVSVCDVKQDDQLLQFIFAQKCEITQKLLDVFSVQKFEYSKIDKQVTSQASKLQVPYLVYQESVRVVANVLCTVDEVRSTGK